ncbi:unnamed protein product [Prorocentrum cordatum]|uniref:Alpha-1,3-glucosyltransferase n=1 Tax=Prorocentrum cordatum TaxID=2364126 RepID=A0ABN9SQN6_9DINO|nr:unnamed protein product [Polarella glacialis]
MAASSDQQAVWARVGRLCENHGCVLSTLGVFVAVAFRCAVAVSPHSGEATPPMFGDYEAQRHWMEITTALPALEWYENTTDNDLLYWGLDYPPLTAYHSLTLGQVGHALVPECFALSASRGHESVACKLFMRASVVLSDLLVYLPGCACAVGGFAHEKETSAARTAALLSLWLLPPLVLIDHGHFQYNGVCFGLCLAAAGCVARGRVLLGSVLFTSGLLFKQIALYYAPAFFFGILAHCLQRGPRGLLPAVWRVGVTGAVVLATASAIFSPWLLGPWLLTEGARPQAGALGAAGQVLRRMFPFGRGLYEDKVANVWCSISVVVKLHRLLQPERVPLACAGVTLAALLPTCACCLRTGASTADGGSRPSPAAFAAALAASAFAFFLFAFQVHEKAILFPCVAACLLPLALGPQRRPAWAPALLCHLVLACNFSMFPLVVKDKLIKVYAAQCLALVALCEALPAPGALRAAFRGCYVLAVLLHCVHALVAPPARYPDAWTLLITGSSCGYFVLCLGALTVAQLRGVFDHGWQGRGQKEE